MSKELKITKALLDQGSWCQHLVQGGLHGDQNALLRIRLFTDIDDLQKILRMCGTRGFPRLTANPQTYQKKRKIDSTSTQLSKA